MTASARTAPRRTACPATIAALAVAACAVPPTRAASAPTVARAEAPRIRRIGPECDSAIAHVRAVPDDPAIEPGVPDSVYIPPLPIPESVHGTTVLMRFPFDSSGRVEPSAIAIEGARLPADYAARLREAMSRTHFIPAGFLGCAVPGTGTIKYSL